MTRLLGFAAFCAAVGLSRAAAAAELGPAVDVAVHDEKPPARVVALEWNPLPLFVLDKLSLNVVVTPVAHHALVVSPYGVSASTAAIDVYDSAGNASPTRTFTFRGLGAELGYRYYTGEAGPRGFFAGPSFVFGAFDAAAADGSHTHFTDAGLAADVGYEALVGERVALSLGGGAEYLFAASSLPEQQFPARVYANRGVSPRFLFAVGWSL
ncbi:MAG TPA: hypothetical protein VMI54_03050 [Polyangiaceae bacterium]|nr:hypothetical protein [Polyangiaceae bacterium]